MALSVKNMLGGGKESYPYTWRKYSYRVEKLLPNGYTDLRSIKGTGTQYLALPIEPTNYLSLDYILNSVSDNTDFIGNSPTDSTRIAMWVQLSQKKLTVRLGSSTTTVTYDNYPLVTHIENNGSTLTTDVNGIVLSASSKYTGASIMGLGCRVNDDGSSASTIASFELADHLTICVENGIEYARYYPCSNPQGVVGLYDVIGRTFYSSSSATGFVAGAIAEERVIITKEYIGETVSPTLIHPVDGQEGDYWYELVSPKPPYAWGKYVVTQDGFDAIIEITRTNTSPYTLSLSSSDIDLSTLTASDFVGYAISGVHGSNTYTFLFESDSVVNYNNGARLVSFVYDATSKTIVFDGWTNSTSYQFETLHMVKDAKMVFVEYVTDKNPLKYPNGEVHTDGFFYRYANEGLYIWRKYEYIPPTDIVNPTMNVTVETSNLYINSASFDYSGFPTISGYVDGSSEDSIFLRDFLSGFSDSANSFSVSSNSLYFLKGTTMYKCRNAKPSTNGRYYVMLNSNTVLNSTTTFTYNGTKTIPAKIGDMVDYVVSDNENAYPDGGGQDGYYYEKVGGANVSSGTFTITASNTYSATIDVGFEGVKTFAVFVDYGAYNNGSYMCYHIYDERLIDAPNKTTGYSASTAYPLTTTFEGTKVTIGNTYRAFMTSTPYYWVAIR